MKTTWRAVAVGLCMMVAGQGYAAKAGPPKVSGVANLNEASLAQLDMLPGVSAKAAQKIVDYRKQHPFTRAEELVKVKGFGKKKFDKLKPFVGVQGPTTLKKVRASKTQPS
jgi:competence protein ComEA